MFLAPKIRPRSPLLATRMAHPTRSWAWIASKALRMTVAKPSARHNITGAPRSGLICGYGQEATESVRYNNTLPCISSPLRSESFVRRVAAERPASCQGRAASRSLRRNDGSKDPFQLVRALGVHLKGLVEDGGRCLAERSNRWH
jgi:hypothetical protein